MAMRVIKFKRNGFVLIASLIMLILVTGLAVTLLTSSSIDIKMMNAAQESEVAITSVYADSEQAITQERKTPALTNRFLFKSGQFPADPIQGIDITAAGSASQVLLFKANSGPGLLDCPRSFNPTPGIKCNMLIIETSLNYGTKDTNGKGKHKVKINSGIAQEMGTISS